MTEYTATLVDAIAGDSTRIPASSNVAGYLTGQGIAWSTAEWSRFLAARVRILQEWTTDQLTWLQADVLDVEARALTLPQAVEIARYRAAHKLASTTYIEASQLAAARAAMSDLTDATFFVANWNLTAAEARALIRGDIVAIQYASPTAGSKDALPGTDLTIIEANVDLSIASVTWLSEISARWPKPKPKPAPAPKPAKKKITKPHPKTAGGTIGAAAIAAATAFAKTKGIHLDGAETTLLTATGAFLTATLTPAKKKA